MTSTMAAALVAIVACAQWSFTVDTTFRVPLVAQTVNDLLLNEDGSLIASGRMTYEGQWPPTAQYPIMRFNANGQVDNTLLIQAGGGKLTPWQDRFYVATNAYPLRVLSDGALDPAFISLNLGLYFSSLQGGDYHVFPDGRVVITGLHQLSDSARGFVGRHSFVWFTNTGYLDTTRIHRSSANCAVYQFKELPPGSSPGQAGQFIVNGICDQFDGQPVDRVFRLHADGSVDTSFHTGVYTGLTADYLPLNDGRVYVAGNFRRTPAPDDTLCLARFRSNGSLDTTFSVPHFGLGALPHVPVAKVLRVQHWLDGNLLVTGLFQFVNGQPRRGICLLDTNGVLLPAFADQGVSPYVYTAVGETLAVAAVTSTAYDSTNAHLYIAGAYSGYTDATGHYPDQRFITRLKVSELSTAVPEQAPQRGSLQLWPNPARGQVWLHYALPGHQGQVHLRVRDSQGRVLFATPASGEKGQVVWDSRGVAPGVYTVELVREGKMERSERLIIQP